MMAPASIIKKKSQVAMNINVVHTIHNLTNNSKLVPPISMRGPQKKASSTRSVNLRSGGRSRETVKR